MPANIEKMVYKGAKPWHNLGEEIDHFMTAEEGLVKGGLDFEVELVPVWINGSIFEDAKAVVRKDTKTVFKVVGNQYTPLQNRAAFKFFDGVVGAGAAIYETIGSLRGGRRIWILANLKESLSIQGDEVAKYVVLSNSHDGSTAVQMFNTPIRVVCENTLEMAVSAASASFYARHTSGVAGKVESAREILGLVNIYYANFAERANLMAIKQLAPVDMPKLLYAAFKSPEYLKVGANEELQKMVQISADKVKELVEVDRGEYAPKLHGTVYEAYNAVTKYTDHYRDYRGNTPESRLNGVWFGGGNIIKTRALDWCMDYCK